MNTEMKSINETLERTENESELNVHENILSPSVDIYESDDEVLLLADMAGVNESDVEITLEENTLTIGGKSKAIKPEKARAVYSEFAQGVYRRTFRISNEIDTDKIEATLKEGILKVVLPRVTPVKRKIEVKVN